MNNKLGEITLVKGNIREGMSTSSSMRSLLSENAVVAQSDDSDISTNTSPEMVEQLLANTRNKVYLHKADSEEQKKLREMFAEDVRDKG